MMKLNYFKHIKNNLLSSLAVVAVVSGTVAITVPSEPTYAIEVFQECGSGPASDTAVCKARDSDDANTLIKTVVNTLLFFIGALSVVMIIIGGIRYVTYNGEASRLATAKSIITYAIVGLVVAILSYAIVNFVVGVF